MLRICHPRRTAVDVVQSELLWLAALRQEVGVNVPEPVLNQRRHYVTVVADPGMPHPRLCVLFHWTHGRFQSQTLTPAHLFRSANSRRACTTTPCSGNARLASPAAGLTISIPCTRTTISLKPRRQRQSKPSRLSVRPRQGQSWPA